jgi:nucleotide-binding universal stress UspA family protein
MKILMCTDGEEYAEQAIRFGSRFARVLDADVTVLHVLPKTTPEVRTRFAKTRKKWEEWNREIPAIAYLARASEILAQMGLDRPLPSGLTEVRHVFRPAEEGGVQLHLVGHGPERVRLKLRDGNPAEEILSEAQQGSYDLIMTGSRGHKGRATYFIGSTALRVAEFAPCSILIAKNIKEQHDFLMCTDGSKQAEQAELFGAVIARALEAQVTVLSVASGEAERKATQERARRAEMVLNQLGIQARVKVRVGRPSEEIIEEAKDHDIVVMGASGSSAVRRFFLGSVPLKVIEYGECPILLVRGKPAGRKAKSV